MLKKYIRGVIWTIASGCLLASLVIFGGLSWLKIGYWMDKRPIQRGFDEIPGCKVLWIGGNEDMTLEHITAKVQVEGKGLIVLSELGPESFKTTGEMRLKQIGHLQMEQHSFGYMGMFVTATHEKVKSHAYADWIDIGAEGPYMHEIPFRVRSVQDVINHYDDIVSVLSKWPHEPEKLTVTANDGTIYEAWVKDLEEKD